jgi:hypothetical protein
MSSTVQSTIRLKFVPTPLRLGEILPSVGRIWTSSVRNFDLAEHPSWTLEQVVDLVRPYAITAGSSGCFQRADGIGTMRSLGQAFKCRESC